MTHGTQVVVITLSEMQLGILVVDTRNSFDGRISYDSKARALHGVCNRQGLFPWFGGSAPIYRSNIVGFWVYFERIMLWVLSKGMLSLALVVDTDGVIVILEPHGCNT